MDAPGTTRPRSRAAIATGVIFVLTVGQLLVATVAGDNLEQFADKGFGARLVAYPLLMLVVPVLWLLRRRQTSQGVRDVPWTAFALVMAPFLVDVTGNTLDLYDALGWWDDANHFVNWALLCGGLGLLLSRVAWSPRWALIVAVVALGSVLALCWELGEWYTFIRHGTEIDTAYEDTLADQALGTLGAVVAGLLVGRVAPRRPM
jgi:hypothetical protein